MLDVIGSIVALILFSPFFIIIPILIKLVSKGPVFFKQDRVGQGGGFFTFLKFRTMKANIDSTAHQDYLNELMQTDKPMTKLDKNNDPRIIPLGKFIRKSSIDELPQLINVLKGDMSLVGPRPCLPYEAKEYLKWHKYRFDIKPGMTGRWQVSGKNRLTFKEMIRLDIMYAKTLSLWTDLWILVLTIPTVISMIIEKFAIDAFFNKIGKRQIPEEQFKEFIKRYYSDIYNVDKLEFLDDKLKNYNIDLVDLMLLLSKLNRLSPTYNVAKRYFGICRLIDCEKKSQLNKVEQPNFS
jgi:lipopolysaccharide/colanic/teichoic acid biosynthesis glycosyltransferase